MDIIIDKCLKVQLEKEHDFSFWLNLWKLVEHELPFVPPSKAHKYFETELQITEKFLSYLREHPQLDGQQTISRAFYKLTVMADHLQNELTSVLSPETMVDNKREDQDHIYAEVHKPWHKVKFHEKAMNWEVGPRRRKLLFMRNRRLLQQSDIKTATADYLYPQTNFSNLQDYEHLSKQRAKILLPVVEEI